MVPTLAVSVDDCHHPLSPAPQQAGTAHRSTALPSTHLALAVHRNNAHEGKQYRLSLSCPMSFFILFCPPVLLRRRMRDPGFLRLQVMICRVNSPHSSPCPCFFSGGAQFCGGSATSAGQLATPCWEGAHTGL